MCGICGEIRFKTDDTRVNSVDAERMLYAIRHRGPDASCLWVSPDNKACFGHARLKIIDLSDKANQPMSNEDGSLVLACNGEIYNYRQLQDRLKKNGHKFRSNSDNEVILHLFEEMGMDLLSHLDGMYSFAIWDSRSGYVYLARDRAGKKPLYYSHTAQGVFFASEIKALLANSSIKKELNHEAVYNYFTFAFTPAPATMFKGICKLPAANYAAISLNNGEIKINCYWQPSSNRGIILKDEKEWLVILRKALLEAVRKRLVADVPVAIYLSGGLDSSLITALASIDNPGKVNTLCIGYSSYYDMQDIKWAKDVAAKYSTNHHEIIVNTDNALGSLDAILSQFDDLSNDSAIPFYFLSQKAKELGFKVVLIGEGSDEVFSGYRFLATLQRYHKMLARFNHVPLSLRAGLAVMLKRFFHAKKRFFAEELLTSWQRNEELFWGMDILFRYDKKGRIFLKDFYSRLESGRESYDIVKRRLNDYDAQYSRDFMLARWFYLEIANHLPECILSRVDKGSMQMSIEARAPYLDKAIIDYSMSIPDNLKINNGECKYILKKLALDYLPRELIYRKKMPLPVPYIGWLENGVLNDFGDAISKTGNIFNTSRIMEYYAQCRKGFNYYSDKLWAVYLFAKWHNKWFG